MVRVTDDGVVLVDKPFARSTEEADRVIQLAQEKKLLVTCFQNRRWVSEVFVRLGECGDVSAYFP